MQKYFYSLIIIFSNLIFPQEWVTLSNAPFVQRNDDLYFINPDLGWAVNGNGEIWKTTNGGLNWTLQFNSPTTYFRSVGFIDSLKGFAGNLGTEEFGGATDTNLIYRTINGGNTWTPVQIFGDRPRGVCGMRVINNNVVYAVGRVRGPSHFIRTTDGGNTWFSQNMNNYAAGLLDLHFFSPDTGYILGLSNKVHAQSRGLILRTTDGGFSWDTVYVSSRDGEWCWKITFPSRNVGYISLQRNIGSPVNFLKTTDGGTTWFEKQFFPSAYFVQGIGFADENTGWIGGNSTQTTYKTTDGGNTWQPANFGVRINRFKFFGDSLGYASGQTIYKYKKGGFTSINDDVSTPTGLQLYQNYPNPMNPSSIIKFSVPFNTEPNQLIQLKVYDALGSEVAVLIDEVKEPGEYEVLFNTSNYGGLSSGVYFYTLSGGNNFVSRKLIIIK